MRWISDSVLGTLPFAENTESLLSLNTTTSNPSQFPPTAAGNDSVSHLPRWHIPLSKLVTLQSLVRLRSQPRSREKEMVNVIVCVMAVAQPVLRQRKEEKARGATGTLWIGRWEVTAPPLGDEDPVKCDVKLWEGCARDWGDDKVRKGDVVLLESASRFEAIRPADVDYTQTSSLNPPMLKIRLNSYCPRTRYTALWIHPWRL